MFKTIAHVDDPAIARVLAAALRAHGFHPLEGSEDGLPGLPVLCGGVCRVPEEEARDAQVLAEALLLEMRGGERGRE